MKKLIYIFLVLTLICGCGKSKDSTDRASEFLGIDTSEYVVTTYYDTHGGFHGDGETVLIMKLTEEQAFHLNEATANHFCRHEIPFSDSISIALYGGLITRSGVVWNHGPLFLSDSKVPIVPEITNGYYLFYDRHSESTDPSDDTNLHIRGSWNFDLAVYDAETRALYYLVLDT